MNAPLPIVWHVPFGDTARETGIRPALAMHNGSLLVGIRGFIVALAAATGQEQSRVLVDPTGASRELLCVTGDLVVTEYPLEESRTRVVGVRGQDLVLQSDLDFSVARRCAVLAAGLLYAAGIAAHKPKLVAIELEHGLHKVDVRLPWGAQHLIHGGDRLILVNRFGTGVYTVAPDGTDARVIEQRPTFQVSYDEGWLAALLETEEDDWYDLVMRAPNEPQPRWHARARWGASALRGGVVAHVDAPDGHAVPVVRDAASGDVRWRGQRFEYEVSRIEIAGDHVFFWHWGGISLYHLAEGRYIGEIGDGKAVLAHGGRIYVATTEAVMCLRAG